MYVYMRICMTFTFIWVFQYNSLNRVTFLFKTMRTCSFPGCKSGSTSERNYNKIYGVCNKSLFKFPKKDIGLRQKWEQFLGRKASDTEVLCELHFKKKDVQKNYEVMLPNRHQFTMKRGKITLNPGAIPQVRICTSNSIKENIPSSDSTVDMKFSIIDSQNKEIHNIETTTSTSRKILEVGVFPVVSTSRIDMDCNTDKNIDLYNKFEHKKQISHLKNDPLIISERAVTSSAEPGIIEMNMNNTTAIIKNVPSDNAAHMEVINFSLLKRLNQELENVKLPEGWAYLLLKNFLLIGHWGRDGGPARKEFYIYSDGLMQIFFDKHAVFLNGLRPSTTITNILHNIKIIHPLLICDGTGLKDRCRKDCTGYINPILYSRIKYGHIRCVSCKKMRQKMIRLKSKCKTSSKQK